MKRKEIFKLGLILALSLINCTLFAITVDGNAYLENQTDHSGIEVFLERTAPSSLTYTVYTNASGYYTAEIETGLYDITYSKGDYFNEFLIEQSLFSNTTLSDITLLAHTTIINVPSMFTTIQGAINRAYVNDTILIAPGTYVENINYNGKNIVIGSLFLTTLDTTYISQTIIDGNNTASVVKFISGENNTAILSGLTITNGYSTNNGGGIYCYNSSPSLSNLKITGNSVYTWDMGGGIYCQWSSPSLENVTISNNYADRGAGIYCQDYSSPNLTNVTISENSANRGGGMFCFVHSSPNLTNVTISENSASRGGGIYSRSSSSPTFTNVTISGNSAAEGGGIYCEDSSPNFINTILSDNTGDYGIYVSSGNPSITYSDFYNNENGNFYNCDEWIGVNLTTNANGDSCDAFYNIQFDPLFVNSATGDYHLTENSPCIDAGDPNFPYDPDETIVDMGAFYYDQSGIIYPPVADFVADITEGYAPLTINFTDLSTQGTIIINQWYWDFGNEGSSSDQNPIYEYLNPGIYSVTLTVTDENDSTDTETKIDYITVFGNDPPAPPTNVQVDIIQPDAVVSWTAVDTTIYGDPIIPDGYILKYNEMVDDEHFWFLTFTTDTTHTHDYVAQYSTQMFYKVIAIVNYTTEQIEYLERLNNSQEKVKWSDVKRNLNDIRK